MPLLVSAVRFTGSVMPLSSRITRLTRAFATNSNASTRSPVYLALMGAPGVGKGTFASRLAPHFNIPTISTGDLIRAEIKNNTPIGQIVKAASESGQLIEDALVYQLLSKRLKNPDCKPGFILDGYPRRVSQAQQLATEYQLDLVVNISLPEEILVEKACARRVCADCGNGYNIADIKVGEIVMGPLLPKKEGVCDKCSGKLIQRKDDTEATVRTRLTAYHNETKPIINHYAAQGLLVTFDVKKGVSDLPALIQLVESELAKRAAVIKVQKEHVRTQIN